jgi:hypothetical protein
MRSIVVVDSVGSGVVVVVVVVVGALGGPDLPHVDVDVDVDVDVVVVVVVVDGGSVDGASVGLERGSEGLREFERDLEIAFASPLLLGLPCACVFASLVRDPEFASLVVVEEGMSK